MTLDFVVQRLLNAEALRSERNPDNVCAPLSNGKVDFSADKRGIIWSQI